MKRNSRSLPKFTMLASWPVLAVGGMAVLCASLLYTFRLYTTIAVGPGEQASIQSVHTLSAVMQNPMLLAFKLPANILQAILPNDVLAGRLASVGVALTSLVLFYMLACRWYGRLSGSAVTALFATSSWMLHTGRYAAGYGVLVLVVLLLMNVIAWSNTTERSGLALLVFAATAGFSLFVPGGIWFVTAAAILSFQSLRDHWGHSTVQMRSAAGVVLGITTVTLIAAIAGNPHIVLQFLGLPDGLPAMMDSLKQAALGISAFLLRGPGTPETWLSHTPILDAACSALLILGTFFYAKHLSKPRTRLILVFAAIGAVLVTLNGASALSYLVPIVYILVGGGLAFLLYQWKKVFPRNPFAKWTALAVVGLLLLCVIAFHAKRYFIAWPNSPATAEAYDLQASADRLPYLVQ